jgi:hypothetical protein
MIGGELSQHAFEGVAGVTARLLERAMGLVAKASRLVVRGV